jgi:outer membrane protein OmpA-like peptidoglycan-associated protein
MTSNSEKEEIPPVADSSSVDSIPKVDSTTVVNPVSSDTISNAVTNELPANPQPAPESVTTSPAVPEKVEEENKIGVNTNSPIANTTPANNRVIQKSTIAKPKDKTHTNFAAGSASINKISNELINEISDFLTKNPNSTITINGYSSSDGDLTTNVDLSQKRAENVRNYLIKKGVPASQLQAEGKGVENPIGDNNTIQGRMQNRRTEIVF